MPTFAARYHENNRILLEELQRVSGPGLDAHDLADADASWKLQESETDLALLSPLFFGKRESDLALLGGACVAAVGATGEWLLHFHAGLRSIRTVGYFGERGMPTILAEIVLKEKYGMHPRMQPLPAPSAAVPLDALLATVDALLTTSDAQRADLASPSHIDLIDEWFDMTQLPLVREVFIGWEARLNAGIDAAVRAAGERADADALQRVEEKMHDGDALDARESIPAHFRYRYTEDVVEGLQMFFQLAFFYGLHRDIPDFVFWQPEEE